MDIYQLEAFEAVVTHGSFTRAAADLHLTQPAVTRQIAALEASLRTRLFERLGRGVRLTSSGEALHRQAAAIVRLVAAAREEMADIEAGRAGHVAIGASTTLATYVLPVALGAFRRAHGRVVISVHTGLSAEVVEMVRSGQSDLGLVTTETADRVLTQVVLGPYETRAVVPAGHPMAAHREVGVEELARWPMLLMETGTSLRAFVDRLMSSAGVEEQVSVEIDNVEAIKRMVEAGIGISFLPEVAVREEVRAGRLVAIAIAGVRQAHRRIVLARRRDRALAPAARAFAILIEERLA